MYSECVKLHQVTYWKKGGKTVFNRINWSVLKGERVLVMGNSDSGCKELFHLIAGYRPPQEGTVSVTGRLSVIRESFPLLEGMTLKDYFNLALEASGERWKKKDTENFLKCHGLWEKREYKGENLTIEEQCRLQIAMSEILKADVVIMEPCWKYMSDEDAKRYWSYVKERLDKKAVSFICFSDIRSLNLGDKDFSGLNWFTHIYILESGALTEIRRGGSFEE